MAEFVQRHLEELLPSFTGLQRTKILSDEEVKTLIQKVRQFEYSVNKRTKRAKDYLKYAEYLSDLLELISIRRKAIDVKQKRDDIEKPLKLHAAHLFRICSERFKKAEYYQKEIDFLNKNAMFHILTKTYTRLLQFHGTNPRNHEQAGRWEYFENKSAENARVIFQFAVRKFPKDVGLWVAFIEMEIAYVVMLVERRAQLTGSDVKGEVENETLVALEGVSDAVFQFKLVEIVLNQGLEAVDNKNELLFECYKVAHKYGKPAEKAAKMVFGQLWPENNTTTPSEEAYLAEVVKDGSSDESTVSIYMTAYERCKTERMIRLTLKVLEDELQLDPESFVKQNIIQLLQELHRRSEATDTDYKRLLDLATLEYFGDDAEKILVAALKKNEKSSKLWAKLVELQVNGFLNKDENDRKKKEANKIMDLLDLALENVPPKEALPIWEYLIDFSVAYFPLSFVEKVFKKALIEADATVVPHLKTFQSDFAKALKESEVVN